MSESLAEGLTREIKRCTELAAEYDKIPTGVFGALMIRRVIDYAIGASASGDVGAMLRAFSALEECQ